MKIRHGIAALLACVVTSAKMPLKISRPFGILGLAPGEQPKCNFKTPRHWTRL